MLVYLATATAAALVALIIVWKNVVSVYKDIPCPGINIPLIGTASYLKRDPHELFNQLRQVIQTTTNYTFLLWLSWKPSIISSSCDYSEIVLNSKDHIRKSYTYKFLHSWLGTGLLTSYGSKWKTRRRIITPSFHFSILNTFSSIFESHSEELVHRFNESKGKPVDIQPIVGLVTLQSICETAMGVQIDTKKPEHAAYCSAIMQMNTELQYRLRSPWIWPDFIYYLTPRGRTHKRLLKLLHDYTIQVINKRVTQITKEKKSNHVLDATDIKKKQSFLNTLLELHFKDEIDINGIREEVDTFMFEGHDTTSSGIAWCLYLLGKYPQHQKQLQDEIDNAAGSDMAEKIRNMTFLDQVVKETLRLYPPVPMIARAIEKDIVVKGKNIYKGTDIFINITNLHRNPSYWENPDMFNPGRFGEDSFYKRNPYCYVPFSAGPRNCVGQKYALLELKMFVFNTLKHFNLKSIQRERDLETAIEVITKSKNGLLVEFTKR